MSFDANTPIYLQIAQQIRRDIGAGKLKEGEQLMSTTQYSKTFRINPATAQKAFGLLVDEGLVKKRRGLGMFVAAGAFAQARSEDKAAFAAEVLAETITRARELGFSFEEITNMIRDLWQEDGND